MPVVEHDCLCGCDSGAHAHAANRLVQARRSNTMCQTIYFDVAVSGGNVLTCASMEVTAGTGENTADSPAAVDGRDRTDISFRVL